MSPLKRKLTVAIMGALLLAILNENKQYFINDQMDKKDNSVTNSNQVKHLFASLNETKKTIQWYDSYHNGHGLRMKAHHVRMGKCKYDNCQLLEHNIVPERDGELYGPLSADAVIFQGCHLGHFLPPIRRDADQVFVFAERETWWYMGAFERMIHPALNKTEKQIPVDEKSLSMQIPDVLKNPNKFLNTFHFRSLFNWTMTYRRDSDIYLPYGEILTERAAVSRGYIDAWKQSEIDKKDYDRVYYKKFRDVVWLVSDCNTKSEREKYVQRLRKYINVDIYGACGTLSCPKQKFKSDDFNCLSKIEQEYRFILSFENTFHTDYVTEKLFDWFSRDIVQVVYGMADYAAITPPVSVINADDFQSPKELARFMKAVGSDKNKYVKYLKVKDRHLAVGHDEMQQKAYCKICEKLNNLDDNRRVYPNIGLWWQLNDTSGFENLYQQAIGSHSVHDTRRYFFYSVLIFFICSSFLALCYFRIRR